MDPLVLPQLVAGLIYLLGGADFLVRGSVALARRMRVSPVFVAISVVAVGTSLPELVVTVRATATGHPGLILGNVVGSNIANVLLVGGAAAAVAPVRLSGGNTRRTSTSMMAGSLLFAGLCLSGALTPGNGALLLAALTVILAITTKAAIEAQQAEDDATPLDWVLGIPSRLPTIVLLIVLGVLALPLGADYLVRSSVEIAALLGVSETVIGLSIVAIGTSMPEVATAVVAARQRRPLMVVGTIIGSNTFNVLGVMGVTAVISAEPVGVTSRFLSLDLPVMVGVSALLTLCAWLRLSIGRGVGLALVAGYAAYLVALYMTV